MSKLGRLGHFFVKVGQFAPVILALTPLAPISGIVGAAIQEAEALKGATGEQKLAHVMAIAVDAAKAANSQAGKVVVDPAKVQNAVAEAVSAVITVTNLVKEPA